MSAFAQNNGVFAITAFVSMILNLTLRDEIGDLVEEDPEEVD